MLALEEMFATYKRDMFELYIYIFQAKCDIIIIIINLLLNIISKVVVAHLCLY